MILTSQIEGTPDGRWVGKVLLNGQILIEVSGVKSGPVFDAVLAVLRPLSERAAR